MTREEKIKEFNDFKKSLDTMTEEELKSLLQKITDESNVFDKEVSEKKFKLEKKGQKIVFESIFYFLNKQKIKWQYVLNMMTIADFFNKEQKEIDYALLDTVLRILGQQEFEGYSEWEKVRTINEYFTNISEEYRNITDRIYELAERFAAVDGKLKLFTPVQSEE